MNGVLIYIANFIFSFLSFLFVIRFLLQACRVSFYNPIAQGFVKATDPVLKPLRVVIPGFANIDLASLFAAVSMEFLLRLIISAAAGVDLGSILDMLVYGLLEVLLLIILMIWGAIFIVIIASFIAPGSGHPLLRLLREVTEPILSPARNLLPPMGGLDFSPILVFLLLGVLQTILGQMQAGFA